jgi:capsular polysaccharide biosynthesis protein
MTRTTENSRASDEGSRPPIYYVRWLLQAAWRRRWLLLIPILIAVPAGVAASKYLPLNYVSRSLLLLQESQQTGPLTRQPTHAEFVANEERVAGLRALLRSDYVLNGVIQDLGIEGERERAVKLMELKEKTWLDAAGPNFIEINQAGPDPNGLGKQLETVILRFLEALTSDGEAPDAIQVLFEKYNRDLEAQQRRKEELESELAALPAEPSDAGDAGLAALQRQLEQSEERIAEAGRMVERHSGLAERAGITTPERLDEEIERLSGARSAGVAGQEPITRDELVALRDALRQRSSANTEREAIVAEIEMVQRTISDRQRLTMSIADAELAIAEARERLASTEKRLESTRLMRAQGILRAPELIRVVDPPRDPEFPTRSPIIYLFAALAAGGLLGITLASIAEFMDTRLRNPEEFSEITGAPVVARVGTDRAFLAR